MTEQLVHEDIQGNILQGLKRSVVVKHAFMSLGDDNSVAQCRSLLRFLLDEKDLVATAASDPDRACITVGLSHEALEKLAPSVKPFVERRFNAFVRGMERRSRDVLGESPAPDQERWNQRHVWFAIYGQTEIEVGSILKDLKRRPDGASLTELPTGCAILSEGDRGYRQEHFGFRDDVSNPIVEGRPGDKSCIGNGKFDKERGEWVPIATGEFLLGHPNERGLNALEGAPADVEVLFRNGTFAVFRDLEQHVDRFHEYVREQTKRTKDPHVAARMVGRYEDGRPLESPAAQNQNDFRYVDDEHGAKCPIGAHIRRANPREKGEHRLLRRGMPYGTFSEDGMPKDDRRGIYFVAYNADIEQQFEFLQRIWINGPARDGWDGTDPISASGAAQRRMVLEGDEQTARSPRFLLNIPEFVTYRGGEYYFVPGIGGLRRLSQVPVAHVAPPPTGEGPLALPLPLPPVPEVPLLKKVVITAKELLGAVKAARWRWAKVGAGGLYVREFTALLGVTRDEKKLGALQDLLSEDNRRGDQDEDAAKDGLHVAAFHPRYQMAGIQSLRWVLFQPTRDRDTKGKDDARWVLVLSFMFDGEIDDALAEFIASVEPRRILSYCKGFCEHTDIAEYLKEHRVNSGFIFRDLGPFRPEPRAGGFPFDATREEIDQAASIQKEFELFYDTHTDSADRAKRFLERFEAHARLVPLTPFERRVADEARYIGRLSELSVTAQSAVAAARPDKTRHRGAHAKGHCLLEGTLRVIAPTMAGCNQGVFANAEQRFKVRVRLSNGSPELKGDSKRDARGMAIRLYLNDNWTGRESWPGPTPGVQDFILFSKPVFFAKDVRQFTTIFGILATKPWTAQLARLAGFFVKEWPLKPLRLAATTVFLAKPVGHPLAIEYHSATPYLLGDNLVVKHSVEAVDRQAFAALQPGTCGDFLRHAVEGKDGDKPIKLNFFVHVLPTKGMKSEEVQDIVEDATLDWKQFEPAKVRVAELELLPVDPSSKRDLGAAEAMRFNPWNCLLAHRPLGSLNRARLTAYQDSAAFRNQEPFSQERRSSIPAAAE